MKGSKSSLYVKMTPITECHLLGVNQEQSKTSEFDTWRDVWHFQRWHVHPQVKKHRKECLAFLFFFFFPPRHMARGIDPSYPVMIYLPASLWSWPLSRVSDFGLAAWLPLTGASPHLTQVNFEMRALPPVKELFFDSWLVFLPDGLGWCSSPPGPGLLLVLSHTEAPKGEPALDLTLWPAALQVWLSLDIPHFPFHSTPLYSTLRPLTDWETGTLSLTCPAWNVSFHPCPVFPTPKYGMDLSSYVYGMDLSARIDGTELSSHIWHSGYFTFTLYSAVCASS